MRREYGSTPFSACTHVLQRASLASAHALLCTKAKEVHINFTLFHYRHNDSKDIAYFRSMYYIFQMPQVHPNISTLPLAVYSCKNVYHGGSGGGGGGAKGWDYTGHASRRDSSKNDEATNP